MDWITLEENGNYEINIKGQIRYKPNEKLIKIDGNHAALYYKDKKKTVNVKRLLCKYFNANIPDLENEIWRDVIGYNGQYAISSLGRLKSLSRILSNSICEFKTVEKLMPGTVGKNGYLAVTLRINGKQKSHTIHRLVATHFIPLIKDKTQVNHIDGNKLNNVASNLEWCTLAENVSHAFKLGLCNDRRKGKFWSKNQKLVKL